jgi:hypothetical protein
MDDAAVERLLNLAGSTARYPRTPAMREAVLSRLTRSERRPERPPFRQFALTAAAGVAIVVAVTAVALPGPREAVGEFFGIEGSDVAPLPTPPPDATATPLPAAQEITAVGTPLLISDIPKFGGVDPVFPDGYGEPAAVYGFDYAVQFIVLQYPGFDLWEGRPDGETVEKGLPEGTLLQETTVNGVPARWVSDGSHIVRFLDDTGREVHGSQRTVDRNTLIWRTDYAFYRIETDLPLEEALTIAESLP